MGLLNSGKNRKSIRLKKYDYSRNGLYFVTICCLKNTSFFGEIIEGEMLLNTIGKIAHTEWLRTSEIRDYVILHEFVVMPNHIHMIIELDDIKFKQEASVLFQSSSRTIGSIVRGYKVAVIKQIKQEVKQYIKQKIQGEHREDTIPLLLLEKCMFKIWHRNYYECIIRDERAYENIKRYIQNNPKKWL